MPGLQLAASEWHQPVYTQSLPLMEPRGLLFGSRRAAASSAATCSRRSLNVDAVVFVVFFFPLLIVAAAAGNTTAAARVAVDVGVILDLATALGKKSMLSMEMALEDVYAAHPEFATRVALRARDSRGDVVAAASAGIYYLLRHFDDVLVAKLALVLK